MFRSAFGGFTDRTRGKRIDCLSHLGRLEDLGATRARDAETFREGVVLSGYDMDSGR